MATICRRDYYYKNNNQEEEKKYIETQYVYEDRVKATPRGNAYIIGNGPSRQRILILNLIKKLWTSVWL
jgi:hypothetical protein